jgi:hypothetical protein
MTVSFHSAQQFGALSLFPMNRQQTMICDPSGLPVTTNPPAACHLPTKSTIDRSATTKSVQDDAKPGEAPK